MKKLYDISIDPTDFETGLNAISLVENPAVEVDFLAFAKEEPKIFKLLFMTESDEEFDITKMITTLLMMRSTSLQA